MSEDLGRDGAVDRGSFVHTSAMLLATGGVLATAPRPSSAIGDLFEFKDQDRFAQHLTVQVPNMNDALRFWLDGVGMKVLRTSASRQYNTTVVGFGPEALQQPPDFVPGVSSFQGYGGHFGIELNSPIGGGDEEETVFYDTGSGVQFLQVAVDEYRISKVVKYGGIVESGYGFLQVLTPGGLRLRLLSGVRRDPPAFVAVKVADTKKSIAWYTDVAGMQKMPYPLARAPGSVFEPAQPKDSVFMAYEGGAFGVLLVPRERGEVIRPGSFVSLAVLVEDLDKIAGDSSVPVQTADGANTAVRFVPLIDPDGYVVKFVDYDDWRKELRA